MEAAKSSEELTAELRSAEAEYRSSHRAEMLGIADLRFARQGFQKGQTTVAGANTELEKVQYRKGRAARAAHKARRDVRDARQRNQPAGKLQAAVRRGEGDERQAVRDLKRAESVVQGAEGELRALEASLKQWSNDADRRVRRAHYLRTKIKDLSVRRDLAIAEEKATADHASAPMAVTERAVSALRDLLEGMAHDRNQALRLTSDSPEGGPKLAIDNFRDGDQIIACEDQPVLLVEIPVPDGLKGTTLDISETPEGRGFFISRETR